MKPLLKLAVVAAAAALAACVTSRSSSPGGLVDVTTLDPLIQVEMRYGTARNPLGRPLYSETRALLVRPAAEALARASRDMYPKGYLLLVLDAYRPESVDRDLAQALPADRRLMSSAGAETGHSRGCAVDLSLWDPVDRKEAAMTSAWGETSGRGSSTDASAGANDSYRREHVVEVMRKNGFEQSSDAWWHWELAGCRSTPALDIPFSRIPRTTSPTPTPQR